MTRQLINVATADSGTGDKIRDGGIKINASIDELYDRSMVWEESIGYALNDIVRHPTIRKLVRCITANTDATFTAAKWEDYPSVGGVSWTEEPFTLTAPIIAAGTLTLAGTPANANQLIVQNKTVQSSVWPPGDGFTLAGQTLTWNAAYTPSLEVGDVISVRYLA